MKKATQTVDLKAVLEYCLGRAEADRTVLDMLSPQAVEALANLIIADGTPVKGDRLCHQRNKGAGFTSVGDWSGQGRTQSVVYHLRQALGNAAVLTVRGHGYVLGVLPLDILEPV